jgi:hypothetical protein
MSICSLVSCSYYVLHRSEESWMNRTITGPHKLKVLTNHISIISFNPFIFIQLILDSIVLKDAQIIDQSRQKRTIDPTNVSIKDGQHNFVSLSWSMEFWGEPSIGPASDIRILLFDHDISAINRRKAIIY